MRALRLSLVLFALFLTAFSVVGAQTEPLRIGGTLPGEIAWSPDGAHLLVATSDMTRLYRTGEWDAPLRTFPAALKATWVDTTTILLDDQPLEIVAGEPLSMPKVRNLNHYTHSFRNRNGVKSSMSIWLAGYGGLNRVLFANSSNPEMPPIELASGEGLSLGTVLFVYQFAAITVHPAPGYGGPTVQIWNLETMTLLHSIEIDIIVKYMSFGYPSGGNLRVELIVITGSDYYGTYGPFDVEFIDIYSVEPTAVTRTYHRRGEQSTSNLAVGAGGQTAVYELENHRLVSWTAFGLRDMGFVGQALERWSRPAAAFGGYGFIVAAKGERHTAIWFLPSEVDSLEVYPILELGGDEVNRLHVSNGPSRLVVGRPNLNPLLWDIQAGTVVKELQTPQSPDTVAFSPDNGIFTILDNTWYGLTVWDSATGQQLHNLPRNAKIDPKWMTAAHWNNSQLVLSDLRRGFAIQVPLIPTPLGEVLAVDPLKRWAFYDQLTQIAAYSLTDGSFAFALPVNGSSRQLMFSGDGSRIGILDMDIANPSEIRNTRRPTRQVTVWSVDTPWQPVNAIQLGQFEDVAGINEDGTIVYAAFRSSPTPDTFVYDVESGERLANVWMHGYALINNFINHPSQQILAVLMGYSNSILEIVDIEKAIAESTTNNQRRVVTASLTAPTYLESSGRQLVFSPNGTYVHTDCQTNKICIFKVSEFQDAEEPIAIEPTIIEDAIRATFDASETTLLIKAAQTNEARLQLVETSENIGTLPAISEAIALNGDGTLAATVIDGGIALWDVDAVRAGDLAPLAVYPVTGLMPTQLAFDADNRLIALEPSGVTIYEPLAVSR